MTGAHSFLMAVFAIAAPCSHNRTCAADDDAQKRRRTLRPTQGRWIPNARNIRCRQRGQERLHLCLGRKHVASGRSIQRHSARYPPGTAIAKRSRAQGTPRKNRHSPSQLPMPPTNRLLQFHRKPDEKQLQQKQRKNKFDRLVHRKSSHSQSFAHIRIDASLYISSYRSRMQSILPWYFHSCNFLQFISSLCTLSP